MIRSLSILEVLLAAIGGFTVILGRDAGQRHRRRIADIAAHLLIGVGTALFVAGIVG